MIEIKNIIEDLVFDFIDDLEESKMGEIDKSQKKEIAAYVLNRVKPMYVTSSRGFTNVIVKFQNDPQFTADIMMEISKASKVVMKSYSSETESRNLDREKPYFIIPKMYGKIISSQDFLPVEKAVVYLYIDSVLAESLSSAWKNPFYIKQRDDGIFSFYPMPIEADLPYQKKIFCIGIKIEYNGSVYDKSFTYDVVPSLLDAVELNLHENFLQLDDIYLPKKSLI